MLVAALVMANGCRHFEPAPLVPADSAAALESRSLADPGLHALVEKVLPGGAPVWPLAKWDLTTLTLAAFYFHPSLDVARAHWQVVEAGVLTAGARPNPILSVTPQFISNAAAGATPWDITSVLDWPIETAGKRARRIEGAEQLATAARLGIDAAAWQVRSDLRLRLLEFAAARLRTESLVRELAAQHEVVALLEQRVKAGALSTAEVAPARLAELQSAADLAAAERQQREAQVSVAEAIGVTTAALEGIEIDFPMDAPVPGAEPRRDELQRQALQGRPDLLAALAEYEASQSALRLEIARQYPDLHVGPGYEYDQGLNKWSVIGFAIELPVLNRNEGPIAEAEARRSEVAARFLELQAAVIGQLDRALANRTSAREELERSESVLATERERAGATARALEAGATDRLALQTAEAELARAGRIHVEAQVRLQQALGDLEAAVQRPLDPAVDVEQGRPSTSRSGVP
jgi:outer membrane protein TolC